VTDATIAGGLPRIVGAWRSASTGTSDKATWDSWKGGARQ
jgi:hypothetical protein